MSWLRLLARQFRNGKASPRPLAGLEVLEDRLAPAAVPVISLGVPPNPFLGTSHVAASITFANPSAGGATAPGYAPWDYVVLPNVGADNDVGEGISFDNTVTPNYLGAP